MLAEQIKRLGSVILGGVPVDHFVEVTLVAFYEIAQVVQPITVCVNANTQDSYSGANFHKGLQQINAAQALAFVRQRRDDTHLWLNFTDLDRERRQQAFIASLAYQLKQADPDPGRGQTEHRDRLRPGPPLLRGAGIQPDRRQRHLLHPAHRPLRQGPVGRGRQLCQPAADPGDREPLAGPTHERLSQARPGDPAPHFVYHGHRCKPPAQVSRPRRPLRSAPFPVVVSSASSSGEPEPLTEPVPAQASTVGSHVCGTTAAGGQPNGRRLR